MSKLEANTIDTVSGTTNLTIGSTNSSTVTFENGSATGHMYPAFEVRLSSNQYGVANATPTKINFNTEIFDTDSAYDNSSNYRFTPQKAGKYLVYGTQRITTTNNGQLRNAIVTIYKNGSALESGSRSSNFNYNSNDGKASSPSVTAAVDMNGSSDYIELYGEHSSSDSATTSSGFNTASSVFGAYRIGS